MMVASPESFRGWEIRKMIRPGGNGVIHEGRCCPSCWVIERPGQAILPYPPGRASPFHLPGISCLATII
jgi:hypothetical protein